VLGTVPVTPETHTLAALADFSVPCGLARDHGLRARLAFVADAMSGVPVVPVAVSIRTDRRDWDRLVRTLEPRISTRALVLQSTDFSHFLPRHAARLRDQTTLNVLAKGDLDALARLLVRGDTFLGRIISGRLSDELAAGIFSDAGNKATPGLPLILNLEGVLLPDMPDPVPHLTLAMPATLARHWLKVWNVIAVSLENNHADDLGPGGRAETQRALVESGIASLGQLPHSGMLTPRFPILHRGGATC